jgi:Fe-S cluster assembly protein SufB
MSISEAIKEHPELVRKYLGTVLFHKRQFLCRIQQFSLMVFCYIPKGVRCPMELST